MKSKKSLINIASFLVGLLLLLFLLCSYTNSVVAADSSSSSAEQWLLTHNPGKLRISNDGKTYIVHKGNEDVNLPKVETDNVVTQMLDSKHFYQENSILVKRYADSNSVGPEYPTEKDIGANRLDSNRQYLTSVAERTFGVPESEGGIFNHKDNDYQNMTHMVLSLNDGALFNKGHFDLTYKPVNAITPWYNGIFNISGYFPFRARVVNPLDPFGSVGTNYYSGAYGCYVRFKFPTPTDIESMAKSFDFSDSGSGAASDLVLSALGIIDLPFTDINYPITPYPNFTGINLKEDPQGIYVGVRGVNLNKHPNGSLGYRYKQDPLVVLSVMKLLGAFGDIDGKASGHFDIDLSQYSGNYSTKELENMGYNKQTNPDVFIGADDSPKKILTRQTLPPSPTHKYSLDYNIYTSNSLLSPTLGKGDGKLDNIDDAVVNRNKMDLGHVKSSNVDTWSAYMSPWDNKNTFNTKLVSSDPDNEFDETGSQTKVLPGTNFRERKINFDVAKDGKFIDNPSRFDRVIDFFTKENVTHKPTSGENRKSDIQYVDVTRSGNPDQYNKWVTLTYNGQAHYKDGSTAGLQSVQSNTLQIYQKVTPPTLKLDQLPKTYPLNQAVKITGSVSSSEHYTADKNMTDIYYQLDGGNWQKGTTEQVNSYKSGKFNMELGNDLALGSHTVNVKGTDAFHLDTNIETYKFDITSASPQITKQVVDLNQVPDPKDSDYKNSVTGLPGNQFRYHIHLDTSSGSTNHIIFKDNDLTDVVNFDEDSENYAVIHHNDGSSDERVKLTANDFTTPNTIDFSKKFKSDQIGEGAYIDLYFTVNTFSLVTPVGTVIPNTAHIISTADGDNDGQGWTSNTANIDLYADPIMIKQVKLASDKDSAYTDKLEASPDSDLDYRVQIKPNKDVKDPELNEIKLSDPFDNKLNQGLTLKKVTANYYDADNKIINDQTEVLTPDSQQVVALSHPVVPGGHVDIVYQVHLDQAAPARTTFKNIAYMESSSYGKNPDHQLPNWQTNNAQVTAANPDGTVNFKYVDLDTGKEIAGHDPVQVTGKVGHKVSEYTKDQLAPAYIDGYTVIKEQVDDQAIQQTTKADPVIAQKPQTYTYYYEKAALSMEAPKNWNFGKYNTSQTEATYYLPARRDASGKIKPYTIDVHDAYGVKDWTLKVQQKHQFTGINPTTKKATVLSGAQLNFTHLNAQKTSDDGQDTHPQGDQLDLLSGDQFKLPVGNETPTALMSYHNAGTYVTAHDQNPTGTQYDNPGVKSFAYQFGDKTNAGYSIGLHVPASTKREATDYTTTLTWSLSVAP
ncbi:WxL domain-containing protein [Latilactobacillus fragifolii]|uniref:WxL domain-containing protein n=1 Tax=Latilactobacillus fragifolii TaxID=2814244 RepID=UPI001ABA7419|nr:WxL domain-containing protein [Latilactobacillus fragifolii]